MAKKFKIPLFPLKVVLFPDMVIPLHIFEERYKLMINECLDQKSEFGIARGTDEHFEGIGCAAYVKKVLERYPDGRLNILAKGTRRFRIAEGLTESSLPTHGKPYRVAIVETLEDKDHEADPAVFERVSRLYREAMHLSLGWINSGSIKPNPERLSFQVATNLSMALDEKQAILEMRSEKTRLHRLAEILEKSLSGIREMKRRIGGNGHLA